MSPAADEPSDPRVHLQRQAQEMMQQLMRTSELPGRMGWTDFDFGVSPFDPLLDDLEQIVSSGQRDNETVTALLQIGLQRHITLEVRHALLVELERHLGSEIRLDIREQAGHVLRALQQLQLPAQSIGIIWGLYPQHLMARLKDRHLAYRGEESEMTAADHAKVDALAAGTGDLAQLDALGDKGMPLVDRVMRSWAHKSPSDEAAKAICSRAARWPGARMARTLATVLWNSKSAGVRTAAREALAAMPELARDILDLDLTVHDPPPEVRRALYPALVDLKSGGVVPRMAEDIVGAGGWSQHGSGAEHAGSILAELVRSGDRRAVPMLLMLLSARPPSKDVHAAIASAFAASPFKSEYAEGLKALKAGTPVVVANGATREEFFARYGQFTDRMRPEKFQLELQRVTRLWEDCYHEDLNWKRPRDMARDLGPRELELRQALAREVQARFGRLAGRGPAAALEEEFRTTWLVTPHNDVSGRAPIAIILDERAARGAHTEEIRIERESQAAELYGLALRMAQGGVTEDAQRFLKAVLQVRPGHPFAKDTLDRLSRKEPLPGVGDAGPAPDAPRIIIP